MKLVVNLKLITLDSQHSALLETLKEANKACDWLSSQAFQTKIFKQFDLQKLCYYPVKDSFNLSAQMIVRQIKKVVDSYKIQKTKQTSFKPLGSIAYDDRIISFKKNSSISIWTVKGRLKIPVVCGEHQRKLLIFRKGEVDLIYRKGMFFLNAVCDVPEESPLIPKDILGVDLGVVNIAADSEGNVFSGSGVEAVRIKYSAQRQLLQHKSSKQTQSGKRPRNIHKLLKRLSGREKNFRKHENHVISKKLVEKAKALDSGIALEDLKNIRQRIEKRFRVSQRARISGWSFDQLRQFITYKSKMAGIPVFLVDPRNTSRECSGCGHIEKANRVSQSEFICKNCDLHINADFNAAIIIRGRGSVNIPQSSEHRKDSFSASTGLN